MKAPRGAKRGERFSWAMAREITAASSLLGHPCETCREPFQVGDWHRPLYGPRGATNYHDDCVEARWDDVGLTLKVRAEGTLVPESAR